MSGYAVQSYYGGKSGPGGKGGNKGGKGHGGKYGQASAPGAHGVDQHNHGRSVQLSSGGYAGFNGSNTHGNGMQHQQQGQQYANGGVGGKGAQSGKGAFDPSQFNPADYYEDDYNNYNNQNNYWGGASDVDGAKRRMSASGNEKDSWANPGGAFGRNDNGMPHSSDSDANVASSGSDRASTEAQKATVSQLMLL